MRKLFGIVKAKGGKHRLQTAKLLGVWQQARTRNDTKQNIKAAGRAHELPLGFFMEAGDSRTHGPKTPKKEMPAWSYSDHLGGDSRRLASGRNHVADRVLGIRGTASYQQWSGDIAPRCDVLHFDVEETSYQLAASGH